MDLNGYDVDYLVTELVAEWAEIIAKQPTPNELRQELGPRIDKVLVETQDWADRKAFISSLVGNAGSLLVALANTRGLSIAEMVREWRDMSSIARHNQELREGQPDDSDEPS